MSLKPNELAVLEVYINCKVNQNNVVLIKAIKNNNGQYAFEDNNKNIYSLEEICDSVGKIVRFKDDAPYYFNEWWSCLEKEAYEKITYHRYRKVYCFTENGDEYWYTSTDFNRHYTKIEG